MEKEEILRRYDKQRKTVAPGGYTIIIPEQTDKKERGTN